MISNKREIDNNNKTRSTDKMFIKLKTFVYVFRSHLVECTRRNNLCNIYDII